MAKIFRPNKPSKSSKPRKHKSLAKQLPDFVTTVSHYDHEAKAVCHTDSGRVAFVSGAIQGETIKVRPSSYTDTVIKGETLKVIQPSAHRVEAKCKYFSECGGCQLQYLNSEEQLKAKQSGLESLMQRHLKLDDIPWQPNITGPEWHYRRSARLSIWFEKNGEFNLGFRKQKSKEIIDVENCPVLEKSLNNLLPQLKQMIAQMQSKKAISHVQMLALSPHDTLIFRALSELTKQDKEQLISFAEAHSVRVLLENNDKTFEDIQAPQTKAGTLLEYTVAKTRYQFLPNNFIQVNKQINEKMLQQAIDWLDIQPTDNVLDLFSGVGNFTLALAQKAKHVVAVEGVNSMVKQVKHNAQLNGLMNVSAHHADLSTLDDKKKPTWLKPIDKLLLDPARDGAFDVVKKIPLLKPKQILYVSCNPTTLIRDINVLQQANYKLKKIGLLNMFPHTSHVEAMALLEYK
ncbi:MAG: 23S rRNA (uracil(1939)-C(5))-methyltransferase RlmD [Gammaproteobacteria bacterium]|nr:23S rRNA (uracil(1939)-C(5))-methyltransferase RlmD [Gammaproteobacteria bacterium]